MIWAAFTLGFSHFSGVASLPIRGYIALVLGLTSPLIASNFLPVWFARSVCLSCLSRQKLIVFRQGHSLVVARCSSLVCPVSALQQYFILAQPQSGPLFSFQSRCFLTWSAVTHLLRDSAWSAGLPYKSLKGHSFHIGAASTAAAAGLADWLIKVIRLLPIIYSHSWISATFCCS